VKSDRGDSDLDGARLRWCHCASLYLLHSEVMRRSGELPVGDAEQHRHEWIAARDDLRLLFDFTSDNRGRQCGFDPAYDLRLIGKLPQTVRVVVLRQLLTLDTVSVRNAQRTLPEFVSEPEDDIKVQLRVHTCAGDLSCAWRSTDDIHCRNREKVACLGNGLREAKVNNKEVARVPFCRMLYPILLDLLHLMRPLLVPLVLAFGKFIARIVLLDATPQTHFHKEKFARSPSGKVQV
jgi:hypothetical protein